MKVLGITGFSGAGKTTLIEQLIASLKRRGLRVSVIKHVHHEFDVDRPGKDSWRHRQAGAFEVLLASQQRLALMREFEVTHRPTVHQLIAELYQGADWVLLEGFRDADLLKIEVWRAQTGKPALYMHDDFIAAIATDSPEALPVPTGLDLLDLNAPESVADWLLAHEARFDYQAENHL